MQAQEANAAASVPARTASMWRRFLAFVVDLILVGTVTKWAIVPVASMSGVGQYPRLISGAW